PGVSLRELKLFPPILPPDEPGPDLGRPGSRRRLVLLAAALTTLTEIAVLAEVTPSIEMGGIGVSMSVIPALALGVACGDRLLGRSSLRRVAQWFWVATTGVIAALLVLYAVDGRVDMYCALVASAL